MINGIDISTWQGEVNWDALRDNQHVQFVMIRSSYGDSFKNANHDQFTGAQFIRNVNEARRVGKPHGFYHYAYPEYNSPEEEADYFCYVIDKVGLQRNELLALDFEENWSGDYDDFTNRFLNKVKSHFNNYNGGLYTNPAHLNGRSWNKTTSSGFWVWVALWDNNAGNIPASPFSVVAFKQYSDQGSEIGVNGRVDEDVFYGDIETFDKYGYQPPNPPIIEPPAPTQPDLNTLLKQAVSDLGTANGKITSLNNLLNSAIADGQQKDVVIASLKAQLVTANNTINTDNDLIASYKTKDAEYAMVENLQNLYEENINNFKTLFDKIFNQNNLGKFLLKLFNFLQKDIYAEIIAKLPKKSI